MNETVKQGRAEDNQEMFKDTAVVMGGTAGTLFPVLLRLAETAPIVGPVAKIAFYISMGL